jgi:hypothetical protein
MDLATENVEAYRKERLGVGRDRVTVDREIQVLRAAPRALERDVNEGGQQARERAGNP